MNLSFLLLCVLQSHLIIEFKQKKQQEVVEQQQQDEGPDVSQGKYGVMKMVQSTEKAGYLFELVFFVTLRFSESSHY